MGWMAEARFIRFRPDVHTKLSLESHVSQSVVSHVSCVRVRQNCRLKNKYKKKCGRRKETLKNAQKVLDEFIRHHSSSSITITIRVSHHHRSRSPVMSRPRRAAHHLAAYRETL
jgi:hypothetical protein